MKRILLIWTALFIIVYHAASQEGGDRFSIFESFEEEQRFSDKENAFVLLSALHADEDAQNLDGYHKLIEKLDKKSSKKHHVKWFLEEMFYKSHQLVLKEYKKHSTFNEMLATGAYDCVSGSALMGLLLERYEFDYQIIETDFHVFVLVNDGDRSYVLESTEPRNGFITDPQEVSDYIASFKPVSSPSAKVAKTLAGRVEGTQKVQNSIYKAISLKELAGLQYYNDAIHHFNENDMEVVQSQLIKAAEIYPSGRVMAFFDYVAGQKKELARR
ncbi:hypothetical protein [Echinicola sediminis]